MEKREVSNVKGKIAWHSGHRVRLTGEIEHVYGVDWYVGVWMEGPKKGSPASLAVSIYTDEYLEEEV